MMISHPACAIVVVRIRPCPPASFAMYRYIGSGWSTAFNRLFHEIVHGVGQGRLDSLIISMCRC